MTIKVTERSQTCLVFAIEKPPNKVTYHMKLWHSEQNVG